MSMLAKYWLVKPILPAALLAAYTGMHPALAQVLHNRGFDSPQKAAHFLAANDIAGGGYLAMRGRNRPIDRFIQRVLHAINRRERIVVYGDFDADGVTSTALLVQVLCALGANVRRYIPDRASEGYGLNTDALLRLKRQGTSLVITVDCGIRSVEEVRQGTIDGLDIIVTDHHSLGPELPDAYAVINPKDTEWDYPEAMLAGVGVAYRVAEALVTVARHRREFRDIDIDLDSLLDLVAIGTVADLAPLDRPENRALVRHGLALMNRVQRPGLLALMQVANIEPGTIDAATIGYALGPRINAAGRLDSAAIAYELLTTRDPHLATERALELQALNTQRQDLTRAAQAAVRDQIEASSDLPLIFAADERFRPGIVGLVAGRLTEEFYRPAIVMEVGETESRASCRSIPEFDITAALDQCADLLVRHGGHAQAAGFTILNDNIPAFQERLIDIARATLAERALQPTLEIDACIPAEQLSMSLVSELAQLEPTGHHNRQPTFMTPNLRVLDCRKVGRGDDHLKLRLLRDGAAPLDAIGFGLGAWADQMPLMLDVAYQLEINEYNGFRNLQLNVQDIRPAEGL